MAITASASVQARIKGSQYGNLALSGTYATGGFAVTPAMFQLSGLERLSIAPDAGIIPEYIPTTQGNFTSGGVVKLYWTGAGLSAALAEVTNGTSVTANMSFEADGF